MSRVIVRSPRFLPESARLACREFLLGILLLIAMATCRQSFAAAGEFDTAFGQSGIARFGGGDPSQIPPPLPTDGQATSVITDGTGKLLVTGFDKYSYGLFGRLHPSGALDTTLGGTGYTWRNPTPSRYYRREPIQAFAMFDGKTILIERVQRPCFGSAGGCSISNIFVPQVVATRLGINGAIDLTYGTVDVFYGGGDVLLSYSPTNISLEPDGSLTVIGAQNLFPSSLNSIAPARFDANGQRNPLYSYDVVLAALSCGPAYTSLPLSMRTAPHTNNRLLVTQQLRNTVTQSTDICITRLNQNGTRDTTFGTGGQTIISDSSLANHFPFKILVRSNGSINLLLLDGPPKAIHRPAMVWLTANGALDINSGSLGVTNPLVVAGVVSISAAALQADDKLLLAGYGAPAGVPQNIDENLPRIVRQGTRGEIDFSYGPVRGGYANLYSATTRFVANDIAIAPDGGAYLAGAVGFTQPTIAVAKLLGDPPPVTPASNNSGGGGCGYTKDGPFDPTLPAIALFAAWVLFGRRKALLRYRRVQTST